MKTIFLFIVFQMTIVICQSLLFFSGLQDALYEQKHLTRFSGEVVAMESFASLISLPFQNVPLIFLVCLVGLGAYNFIHHYRESKSVYLMKRLPNRYEYAKRVVTIPIVSSIFILVIVAILIAIYYAVYVVKSPPDSVADGQLELLFDVWFRGVEF